MRQMQGAAAAGQMAGDMQRHAQQTPVKLSDPHDLKHHLIAAHEWDEHDMLRNSHWRNIDHLVALSDYDEPMTHSELRRVHDDEHATQGMRGVTVGQEHFHA